MILLLLTTIQTQELKESRTRNETHPWAPCRSRSSAARRRRCSSSPSSTWPPPQSATGPPLPPPRERRHLPAALRIHAGDESGRRLAPYSSLTEEGTDVRSSIPHHLERRPRPLTGQTESGAPPCRRSISSSFSLPHRYLALAPFHS